MTQEEKLNAILDMTSSELDALGSAYDDDEIEFTSDDVVYEGHPLEDA